MLAGAVAASGGISFAVFVSSFLRASDGKQIYFGRKLTSRDKLLFGMLRDLL